MALAAALILSLPATSAASSEGLRVRGNELVFGADRRQVVQLRGVSRSGTEYACIGGWGFFQSPHPGQIDSPTMISAMASWDINVVRIPLNEDCWLGVNAPQRYSGRRYRSIIERYVAALNRDHLFVILDLHWAAPGRVRATQQLPMADADHAPAFWRSVASAFRSNPDVLFDLYNEPYGIGWSCWLHGCVIQASGSVPAYRSAGMQQLVGAVRSAGAHQPLLLGGLDHSSVLSEWLAHEPRDPDHALVADQHSYGVIGACDSYCLAEVAATARRVPVVFGELGETDCGDSYIDEAMRWADEHGIGYLGWAWDATDDGWSCTGGPSLITNYSGTPTPYGAGFLDHFRALGTPVRP